MNIRKASESYRLFVNKSLGKIAQQLARAGYIEIVQGARGGLKLVVSPEKLTLLDVVETVIGEIFLNDCILRPETCSRSNASTVHRVWGKARNQLRATLREATFADLLKEDSRYKSMPPNDPLTPNFL